MDEAKVVTWLCVLWMLPQEVFTVPGRTRGGKAGRKSRQHRLHPRRVVLDRGHVIAVDAEVAPHLARDGWQELA